MDVAIISGLNFWEMQQLRGLRDVPPIPPALAPLQRS
jgi:hypothetical protein